MRLLAVCLALLAPLPAAAGFSFASSDGGTLDLDAWRGRPVLVVDTALRCAFTPQYQGLQALEAARGVR